jgi:hypothetical protein
MYFQVLGKLPHSQYLGQIGQITNHGSACSFDAGLADEFDTRPNNHLPIALVHTSPANGLRAMNPSASFSSWPTCRPNRLTAFDAYGFVRDPPRRGNEMVQTSCLSRTRAHHGFFVGALLTLAVAIALGPSGSVAQAKSVSSRTKGTTPEAKAVSLKSTRTADSHPFASLHHELLNLKEGQKGLHGQIEGLTGATQRRHNELEQRIDSLTNQLTRLISAQQESTAKEQLLTATIRSMRLLLRVIVGLLLVVCGALLFLVYRLKQFGSFPVKDLKQVGAAPEEAPDEAIQSQWKVSS